MKLKSTFSLSSRNCRTYSPECFSVGMTVPVTLGINKDPTIINSIIGSATIVSIDDKKVTQDIELNKDFVSSVKTNINNYVFTPQCIYVELDNTQPNMPFVTKAHLLCINLIPKEESALDCTVEAREGEYNL